MHEQGAVGCIPLPYLALGAWPQILPTLDGSIDFIEFIECIVARRAALSTSKATSKETNPPACTTINSLASESLDQCLQLKLKL